jgi:DNA-binding NtrC family response regulator
LPRVFIISRETAHRKKLKSLLGRRFESKTFDDTYAAGEAILKNPPDVTIVDIERVWQNEINWLSMNPAGINFKSLPLILVGAKGEEFKDMKALFGNSSQYLTWPLTAEVLIETASTLINEAVEASWEKLPQGLSRPLKMTVEEYQNIATAIENGEPINYNSANDSCTTLITAVRAIPGG